MNWEAASTIAEIVGAIAVVVSLIYLSAQIRQNTRQVEAQAKGQRFEVLGVLGDVWQRFRGKITTDLEIAGIWRRGNERLNQLDADEYVVFDFLMADFFWSFAYNWIMGVEDGLGTYLRDDIADNLLIFDSPGLREWWRTSPQRSQYPGDFVSFIDKLLADKRGAGAA
jgi:hypothetical protein